MLLWYLGVSFAAVWSVFRSPAMDYRLVMAGSVVPTLDVAAGRVTLLHTLVAPVLVLGVVMALTRRRLLLRRRLLGIPIGWLTHLVIGGAWADQSTFWWPALGTSMGGDPPELGRGVVGVVMELIGLAVLGWCVVRFGLTDPARRLRFVRTGQLDRDLARGEEPGC